MKNKIEIYEAAARDIRLEIKLSLLQWGEIKKEKKLAVAIRGCKIAASQLISFRALTHRGKKSSDPEA